MCTLKYTTPERKSSVRRTPVTNRTKSPYCEKARPHERHVDQRNGTDWSGEEPVPNPATHAHSRRIETPKAPKIHGHERDGEQKHSHRETNARQMHGPCLQRVVSRIESDAT